MKDLENREDIEVLVEKFYAKVFADETIGHIFTKVVEVHPETHFPIMLDFWETILFAKNLYHGNIVLKHLELNNRYKLEKQHFDKWLELFFETLDENFIGKTTETAKVRAQSILMALQAKIHYHNNN